MSDLGWCGTLEMMSISNHIIISYHFISNHIIISSIESYQSIISIIIIIARSISQTMFIEMVSCM